MQIYNILASAVEVFSRILTTKIAADPLSAVARGACEALGNLAILKNLGEIAHSFITHRIKLSKKAAYQFPTSLWFAPSARTQIRVSPQSTNPPTQWGATSLAKAHTRPEP
jgi:hypothetical protein